MKPPDNYTEMWALDAHCDMAYMRIFLQGGELPRELRNIDTEAFFRVTLPRLAEGRVRCLFVNVGDIGLLTSSAIITCTVWQENRGAGSSSALILPM